MEKKQRMGASLAGRSVIRQPQLRNAEGCSCSRSSTFIVYKTLTATLGGRYDLMGGGLRSTVALGSARGPPSVRWDPNPGHLAQQAHAPSFHPLMHSCSLALLTQTDLRDNLLESLWTFLVFGNENSLNSTHSAPREAPLISAGVWDQTASTVCAQIFSCV